MGKLLGCVGIAILGFVAGHVYGQKVFTTLQDLTDKNHKPKEETKDEKPEEDA